MFLQRIRVQFPVPMLDGSELPVILEATDAYGLLHIPTHREMHTYT